MREGSAVHALHMLAHGRSQQSGIPMDRVEEQLQTDAGNIIGRHMNTATKNLQESTTSFDEATRTILNAADDLHAQMDALSKRAKDSVGRAKDMAQQMTDAMNKVTKLVGPDFGARLAQLEALTACLERLSALNDAGKLGPMLAAMRGPA